VHDERLCGGARMTRGRLAAAMGLTLAVVAWDWADAGSVRVARPAASHPVRVPGHAVAVRGESIPATWPRPATGPALLFVENRGQVNGPARFVSLFGPPVWLTDEGLRLRVLPLGPRPRLRDALATLSDAATIVTGAQVFLTFEGSESAARLVGVESATTQANYFIGNDPSRWVSHVPTWSRVRYEGLYPGIDADVHGAPGRPEYDLLLEPSADLGAVVVRIEGAEGLSLQPDGALRIETAGGTLVQPPPRTWEQDGDGQAHAIACRYRLLDARHYGFEVRGRHDNRRLIVDPSLVYSTLLGGSVVDQAWSVAVDATGAAVVGGQTANPTDFPVTSGAFSTVAGDTWNGFVAKLSPNGASLEFATFLGGSPATQDWVSCVALTADGDVCVAGETEGTNFPTTDGTFNTTYNGGPSDMFVTRLTSDGSALVYSTFLGGSLGEGPQAIALDGQDRICLVGVTISTDFPVSPNAYQSVKGLSATVIARLSADGSTLEYGSYLEGASTPYGIALDQEGRVHCAGVGSPTLAVTPGAVDTTYQNTEGFVATMDCDAGTLDYASFLGGSLNDMCFAIAVDAHGARYVVGTTESFDFPKTTGSFDPGINGNYDAFVVELSPDGSALEWGTFLGGGGGEEADDLALLADGSVCVVGMAGSSNFPVTPDAYDSVYNNHSALFITHFSADGSQLLYSTLFGGTTGPVLDPSIALDALEAAYVAGGTSDTLFPVTPGAFDTLMSGPNDAYVLKFSLASPWSNLGHGLAGIEGMVPQLLGFGMLQAGTSGSISLTHAVPFAPAFLIAGLVPLDAPFKGGTMVPTPQLVLPLATNASGGLSLSWSHWPAALPSGTELLFQDWIVDPAGPAGFAASNGLSATVP